MNLRIHHISSDIWLSSSDDIVYHTEALAGYHLLIWIISGQNIVEQSTTATSYEAGSRFLIRRNQVIRLINTPTDGVSFKALTIRLTEQKLKAFYSDLAVHCSFLPVDAIPLDVKSSTLLDSFYTSLISAYRTGPGFEEEVNRAKIFELVRILRATTPEIDNMLGSFDSIRKLDISKFMEWHFRFNISMEDFSYLTGRSLSAFNRDFRMTFGMPPQKWLTRKRLASAYHQLTVFKKKPTDVYREFGFENLSHFSFAFRKEFGFPPKDA